MQLRAKIDNSDCRIIRRKIDFCGQLLKPKFAREKNHEQSASYDIAAINQQFVSTLKIKTIVQNFFGQTLF